MNILWHSIVESCEDETCFIQDFLKMNFSDLEWTEGMVDSGISALPSYSPTGLGSRLKEDLANSSQEDRREPSVTTVRLEMNT